MNQASAPPSPQLDWLYGTQFSGVKLGLQNMKRLLAAFPPPDKAAKVIHVAGTNGKGSICAFADSLLRAHGLRTGLFTSPHLVRFHERIRVDGEPIPEEALEFQLGEIREIVSGWDPVPSFFENTLALALRHFERCGVDAIVLETGLGGRLDATNTVAPVAVSVIAAIDYDHQRFLGNTLAEIAGEKAGIFKAGTPVVAAPQLPEARDVLESRARQVGCALSFVDSPYAGTLGLSGEHQRLNAAVAIRAVAAAGLQVNESVAARALAETFWPARFQRFGDDERFIVDAAHNPAAAAVLRETWRQVYSEERATIILGCAEDKAIGEILSNLQPICRQLILTPIPSPRAASIDAMRSAAQQSGIRDPSTAVSLAEALALAQRRSDRILICGSIFLAGEAVARLTGQALPRQMTQ